MPQMPDLPDHDYEKLLKLRHDTAGRFGFQLGCVVTLFALGINLWRAPRPWSLIAVVIAVLLAALNIPIGIALGLLGERVTRPNRGR